MRNGEKLTYLEKSLKVIVPHKVIALPVDSLVLIPFEKRRYLNSDILRRLFFWIDGNRSMLEICYLLLWEGRYIGRRERTIKQLEKAISPKYNLMRVLELLENYGYLKNSKLNLQI